MHGHMDVRDLENVVTTLT